MDLQHRLVLTLAAFAWPSIQIRAEAGSISISKVTCSPTARSMHVGMLNMHACHLLHVLLAAKLHLNLLLLIHAGFCWSMQSAYPHRPH